MKTFLKISISFCVFAAFYIRTTEECFRGFGLDSDDPCFPNNPCLNGGVCKNDNSESGYTCTCKKGYNGTHCEHSICEPNGIAKCANGGNCKVDADGNAICECEENWIGDNCTIDDPCFPQPCLHDGKCVVEDYKKYCFCYDGWAGEFCEINSNLSTTFVPTKPTTTKISTSTTTTTTSMSTSTHKPTPRPNDLRGCSGLTKRDCHPDSDDMIIAVIPQVYTIQDCQYECNTKYKETCKYFIYDNKFDECRILKTDQFHFCYVTTGGNTTNINDCEEVFDDENEEISCLNFREHLCNFLTETLADLPQITDVRKCQLSCIVNPKCGWWIYDEIKQVCQLHPSGHRDCDMVRGTPQPDYEKCVIDGHIHWPS